MRAVFTGLPEASPEELFRRELFSFRLCQPLLSRGMRRSFVECMKRVGEAWVGTEPGLQPGGASLVLYVLVVVAVIASLLRLAAFRDADRRPCGRRPGARDGGAEVTGNLTKTKG